MSSYYLITQSKERKCSQFVTFIIEFIVRVYLCTYTVNLYNTNVVVIRDVSNRQPYRNSLVL